MTDPTDPGRVTGSHERVSRNTSRQADGPSPVGSPLSIVLAVIAVVAGFLLFRSISDDGNAAGGGLPTAVTSPATVPGGGTVPGVTTPGATTPNPTSTVAPSKSGATVVVANASSTGQVAQPMSDQLAALGYTMGEPTSQVEGPENLEESIVYFVAGAEAEAVARALANDMGGLAIEPMPSSIPTEGGTIDGDVLLMLGNDYAGDEVPGPPPSALAVPSVPTTATTEPT